MKQNLFRNNGKRMTILLVFIAMILSSQTSILGIAIKNRIGIITPQTQDIRGLYYMRDLGGLYPGDHEGALNTTQPQEIGYIKCGFWIYFFMNASAEQTDDYIVSSIYYHMWWHEPDISHGSTFTASYNTSRGQRPENYLDNITINVYNSVTTVNNYRLIQTVLYPDPEIAIVHEARNFSCVFAGFGPNVTSRPNQYSFVYINLPNNQTLMNNDSDGDNLNDFQELFVTITNPLDTDTDSDNISDYEEYLSGSDPNNPRDAWGIPDPMNYERNVNVFSDLRWNCGFFNSSDGITYNLYLSTRQPIFEEPWVTNLTDTRYNPGSDFPGLSGGHMEGMTRYFWKIVAKQDGYEMESPVWCFITAYASKLLIVDCIGY
ncbi:MAG: thrombospondin type 3 repeat-containing protein [Methanobacteriota archaeon]